MGMYISFYAVHVLKSFIGIFYIRVTQEKVVLFQFLVCWGIIEETSNVKIKADQAFCAFFLSKHR